MELVYDCMFASIQLVVKMLSAAISCLRYYFLQLTFYECSYHLFF